ncbi:sensor histidine kinase [Pseudokineococcus sp. 1T1Z-3]|uniref:sensor histidine kinase n=1 Tax=Pseudokineococcus sp. 1T1Z-3 TaxID=3132745 RepID=UPI0030A953D7
MLAHPPLAAAPGDPDPAASPAVAPRAALAERRPHLSALLVSLACSLLGPVVFVVVLGAQLPDEGPTARPVLVGVLLVVDVLVGLVAAGLAGFFRSSRAAAAGLAAAGVVSSWAGPAGLVGMVRLGERATPGVHVGVLVAWTAGVLGMLRLSETAFGSPTEALPLVVEVLALGAVGALLLLWGRVRGTRAALLASLRQQAATAERERVALAHGREADVARSRAEERSALAREMHDTVSHRLAVVALHAGALASRDDLPPERAREAARTVRDAAGEASAALRELLLALRSTDPGQRRGSHGGATPLPTSASLEEVATAARVHGQEVVLTWADLRPADLDARSPATGLSLAQVLAELLVNARKHAPGAVADVRLAREDDVLVLRVTSAHSPPAQPPTGTGLGLVGVAERARLLGGSATSGRAADGAFVVEVRLPWRT